MAKASKQDLQVAKYHINKIYDEFKEQDEMDAPYGFEICYDTYIHNEQTSNPSGARLRGAELFKQKCEALIEDDYCVRIDITLYRGTSAKAGKIGTRTIFKKTTTPMDDDKPQPINSSNEAVNKIADLVSERLGLAGIANEKPSSHEIDFVRKESSFSQKLIEIQYENKIERLTDKIEAKDKELKHYEEKISILKSEVENLEQENETLYNQNEENIAVIKKYAPQKILQNTLAHLGTSFLMKFTNNNPKVKETLGALLEDYIDGDATETQSDNAPPPIPVQQVGVTDANLSEEEKRVLLYIEGLTNELKQFNVGQLKNFDTVYSYFKKNPSALIEFVTNNNE